LVPAEFPGSVLVNEKPDEEQNHLKNNYRRLDNGKIAPEFRYFMKRIMPAIAPYRSKYDRYKGVKNLSQMYTITDEAFGLLMLLNEFDNWKAKAEAKASGEKAGYLRKKFVDGRSGNRAGWNLAGLNTYVRICKHLKTRRDEKESIEMEEIMKSENASYDNQQKRVEFDECEEEELLDYMSEQEIEMRRQMKKKCGQPVEI